MTDQTEDMEFLEEQMPTALEELQVRRAYNRTHVSVPDVDREWETWKAGIEETVSASDASTPKSKTRIRPLLWFASAAAACLVLVFCVRGLMQSDVNQVFTANTETPDVIFTGVDGEQSVVNDTSLDFSPKTATAAATATPAKKDMMTVSTPRGKDFKVLLPDGTQVWLNAESSIQFPKKFEGKTRDVNIHGEAYLDVKRDSIHPFIVHTDYFTTTVLGTSFDVRAYSERDALLTLVSGKVDMKSISGSGHKTLAPGDQATWSKDGSLTVEQVDTYPFIQWKNGFFYFNNVSLLNIMQELGRWYNVSIVFENPSDMSLCLHFVAERREKLPAVIKRINDLDIVAVEIIDGVVTVK